MSDHHKYVLSDSFRSFDSMRAILSFNTVFVSDVLRFVGEEVGKGFCTFRISKHGHKWQGHDFAFIFILLCYQM